VTTAAPEPRPVTCALLAMACAETGRHEECKGYLRRLIDWCHQGDNPSGEEQSTDP
jgi:hypothetical protein